MSPGRRGSAPYHRVPRVAGIARALTGCAVASMLSACVRPPPPYDPFKTPAGTVRERVQTIALAPLIVGARIADRETARAEIEPAVTGRLQAGGFIVLPSDEMEKYWRRAAADVGPVYDPITGVVDQTRFDTVQAAVFRELGKDHQVDAVLYVYISAVTVDLPAVTMSYCGTTASIYWPADAPPLTEPTTVAVVLCFNTVLYDLEGRELYSIRQGLEPIETYAAQTRAVRPLAERLREHVLITKAVEETVGPLADAGKIPAK